MAVPFGMYCVWQGLREMAELASECASMHLAHADAAAYTHGLWRLHLLK